MKKNSKAFKVLVRVSIFLLFNLTLSCGNTCNAEFIKLLEDVRNDNNGEIKKYLDNGGSATESCYNYRAGKFGSEVSLLSLCIQLEKLELIKLILQYEKNKNSIPESEILKLALNKNDTFLINVIVNNYNAHLYINGIDDFLSLDKIKLLEKFDYNFDYVSSTGNTLIMEIVMYADMKEEPLIGIVKYLVEKGVKTNVKNNEGKTAYDLAKNERVKEFLKFAE